MYMYNFPHFSHKNILTKNDDETQMYEKTILLHNSTTSSCLSQKNTLNEELFACLTS